MKMYRDSTGSFYRTQAQAKALSIPVTPIEVPTDHAGLCEFLNAIQPPLEYLRTAEEMLAATGQLTTKYDMSPEGDVTMEIIPDPSFRGYKEGDPTVKFMGSRDPKAIFTCTACGKVNCNEGTNG